MIVYIVEYKVWDRIYKHWIQKVSQEGYRTLKEAEDFCVSRGGHRTVQPMVFKSMNNEVQEQYVIHEVYIK